MTMTRLFLRFRETPCRKKFIEGVLEQVSERVKRSENEKKVIENEQRRETQMKSDLLRVLVLTAAVIPVKYDRSTIMSLPFEQNYVRQNGELVRRKEAELRDDARREGSTILGCGGLQRGRLNNKWLANCIAYIYTLRKRVSTW